MQHATPLKLSLNGENYVCVGVVIGAQGILGEVKIKPFITDFSPLKAKTTLMTPAGQTHTLTKVKQVGQGKIAFTLANTTSRNAAEALQGTAFYLPRSYFPADEIAADLLNLPVHNHHNKSIGTIINVFDNGAQTILEIKLDNTHEAMVPHTADYTTTTATHVTLTAAAEAFLTL